MNSLPKIKLCPKRELSWLYGHPWIYSKAIAKKIDLPAGSCVIVENSKGESIGIGTYHASQTIALRMFTPHIEPIDTAWFIKKLEALKKYREALLGKGNNAYRLCYGESDSIPGLVIDTYADHAMVQVNTKGIELLLPHIVEALLHLGIKEIFPSCDSVSAKKEGVTLPQKSLENRTIWSQENGLEILIPIQGGQKTGWFCDQRENRDLVFQLVKEQKLSSLLNLFSYTGGFSLNALKGGAQRVVNVDSDKEALSLFVEMAKRNAFSTPTQEIAENVWQYLATNKETFDLVIVDPPAFVKEESKKQAGLKGYFDLFKSAIPSVKPGGFLMVYSCSHFVQEDDLQWVLRQAYLETKRKFQTVKRLSQGMDHPVPAWFPESYYLKGYLLKDITD